MGNFEPVSHVRYTDMLATVIREFSSINDQSLEQPDNDVDNDDTDTVTNDEIQNEEWNDENGEILDKE